MKRLLLFVVIAAAVLGGLWLGLRPAPQPAVSTPAAANKSERAVPGAAETTSAADAASIATSAAPVVKRFELRPPADGASPTILQVQQGDNVALVVTSARKDELHLHGYDLSLHLQPGVAGTLIFQAEHAGRFDLELHHAHAELAVLEVQPR